MDNKTVSIVSYITIIGWVIAYLVGKDNLDAFAKYHLRQSFGLGISALIVGFIIGIVVFILPVLGLITWVINVFFFVLFIVGIINAVNGQMKPLPIIGKMFEDKFSFIG
ncbi:DUF4870 domain-containing protein [Flavobacterium sp. xlx-214]|uniref:DUF4870 domain-containing protein n=1 Tax=unclassified Flavobacterium TaxID=196869 RepID=UPI0013D420BE|nr:MULTISPECIES: DUF4870 domain-containing protein [unclassified Flavobacterium]MBA5792845.1 DUF4870 domain-containing protein [Flavobacterium sp. xlx-221]QMI83979.1 DUF4870 domain-containing protein [Flavobacterium sp. xlx-214]